MLNTLLGSGTLTTRVVKSVDVVVEDVHVPIDMLVYLCLTSTLSSM